MRGTPRRRRQGSTQFRFIPACAGNTCSPLPRILQTPVHPRLCGEHVCCSDVRRDPIGSSPPVRGTHCPATVAELYLRFIPACAGNTFDPDSTLNPAPVHPRLCGEHNKATFQLARGVGSSPPVRGTLRGGAAVRAASRFIPACAGNTNNTFISPLFHPVHPRLCGEHQIAVEMPGRATGSSPPVRGTRFWSTMPARPISAVHPRLCGEHIMTEYANAVGGAYAGSSPPVRGTRRRLVFRPLQFRRRFIPACAGNTLLTRY